MLTFVKMMEESSLSMSHLMILTGLKEMSSDTQLIATNVTHLREKSKLKTMFKKFNNW